MNAPEHLAEAVAALGAIDPQEPLGTELFEAIARVSVSVAIETVALRRLLDGVEVYLTLRSPDETYANLWHSPGSFLRSGETIAATLARFSQREFGAEICGYRFVGVYNYTGEERGHIIGLVLLVILEEQPDHPHGRWFKADDLPINIVRGHIALIRKAVEAFGDVTRPAFLYEAT